MQHTNTHIKHNSIDQGLQTPVDTSFFGMTTTTVFVTFTLLTVSTEEVMFSFVCYLAGSHKNYLTDFQET